MHFTEDEIEISFYRSSGPGGQHKNVTDSAVRVRHLPTGIVVTSSASRSQLRNKEAALEELERRLDLRTRRAKPRRPTKPTKSSQRRRVDAKRQRSQTKSLRRVSGDE